MNKNASNWGDVLGKLLRGVGKPAKAVGRSAKAVGNFTKGHPKAVAVGAGSLAGAGGAGAYLMSGEKPEPSIWDKGINKANELVTSAVNKGKELTTDVGNWAQENWKPLAGGAAVGIGSILLYELLRREKEKER